MQVTSLDDGVELEEGSVKKELASEAATPEEHTVQQETVQYVQDMIGQMREEYALFWFCGSWRATAMRRLLLCCPVRWVAVKSRVSPSEELFKRADFSR